MKNKLINFINNPKAVMVFSLVVAVILGVVGYVIITRPPAYSYANASAGTINVGASSESDLVLGFVVGGKISNVSVKSGDKVVAGQILATLDNGSVLGSLEQAKAVFKTAEANYEKILNGATGTIVDSAKTSVANAEKNLDQAKKLNATLVKNAYRNMLNSSVTPISDNNTGLKAPIISGVYNKDTQGKIIISIYSAGSGAYFTVSGIADGITTIDTSIPQQISDTGLYIQFPNTKDYLNTIWTINIPNDTAPNYLLNYNAYDQAVKTSDQAIAGAQAVLDQATANLAQVAASARPEDVKAGEASVESAKGALLIAQSAYDNTTITAPYSGTIVSVSITPGQITTPNTSAIELSPTIEKKNVSVIIPKSAVFTKTGHEYVLKKDKNGISEVEVVVGASDKNNIEIVSGLVGGDSVVVY